MDVLRTPDDRFADLPGYPFEPEYAEIPDGTGGSLRVHHVDEGDPTAPVVLLLHGEPSWSYLYRHMIPLLVDVGLRGRSRPRRVRTVRQAGPARRLHVRAPRELARVACLRRARPARHHARVPGLGRAPGPAPRHRAADRFVGVVAANTYLPTGDGTPSDAFLAWQKFSQEVPEMPIGRIINGGCTTDSPRRSSRRTTPRSRRRASRRGRASSRRSCPRRPTTPRPPPTAPPGRCWPPTTDPSSAPSATRIRSPPATSGT